MILYIIRHAIAVEAGLFEGDDSQRPLTGKGQKKMRSIAQGTQGTGNSARPDPDQSISTLNSDRAHSGEEV